jgi:purine-binding chemotaxis protein CheW
LSGVGKVAGREAGREMQAVVFSLGDQFYAADIGDVLEIILPEAVTRVPGAPAFMEGVINLRGRVIPVIDLAGRFGLEKKGGRTERSKIVVVETGKTTFGVFVDDVAEVVRFSAGQIKPPPEMIAGSGGAGTYVKGIILAKERLIVLLDVRRLLSEGEEEALEKAAGF